MPGMKTTTPMTTGQGITSKPAAPKQDHSVITKLPTFADRGAAIAKRLESVKADPKYLKLSPEHQERVRADLYKKYVPASYTGFHLQVPDEKTWVEASGRNQHIEKKLSNTYNESKGMQFAEDAATGASKALNTITMYGTQITNSAFASIFHLNEHYSNKNEAKLEAAIPTYKVEKQIQRGLENFIDARKASIQTDNFWLETHPRDTIIGKLGSDAGELIATLPLYEAVGSLGVGSKVLSGASKAMPLTAKLAASPVGKFVAKRLISGTDMYLATLSATGGDQKAAIGGAIVGGAMESAGSAAMGGLRIAAAPLIKKWTANTIAMGGKPFAQDIAKSAYTEMEHANNWFMKPASMLDITIGKDHQLTHGIIVHPESETTGHFSTPDGDVFHYGSRETQQKGFNELVKREEAKRAIEDPVMAKLHEAEKASLTSIGLQMHGTFFDHMTDKQKLEVLGERWNQINQAAAEAPVHLPDLHKDEVEHDIASQRAASPMLNSLLGDLEKQGVQVGDAVVENNTAQIAKETGISNVQAASKKVAKATKMKDPMSADAFASHKVDTSAYFRAPRNRTQVAEAVSDRSKAGLNKFIDLLKDADGNKIHFENQTQRMLYHYGNRKSLPKGMADSLLYRIRQVKGYDGMKATDIQKEADWLHVHLYNMAGSGRLSSEGNIYNSTKLGAPFSWTKWQKQLGSEADANTIKAAQIALKQHPNALKGFNTAVKMIQKASANIQTPEEYIAYKRALSESATNIVKHVTDKNIGGMIQ